MSPLCVPVCEVTNLTEQQTNVISGTPIAVAVFKKPFLWCCPGETVVKLCLTNSLPAVVNSIYVGMSPVPVSKVCTLPLST